MTIAGALADLLPPPDAPDEAFLPAFRNVAELLLTRATLVAGTAALRPTEIEFYYYGGHHRDEFAHRDSTQERLAYWYFHRTGTSYRGGTYKGLDLTIGREGHARGGVLLRAAAPLVPDAPRASRIEGPSRLVDELLRLTQSPTIADLAARFDLAADPAPGSPLHLRLEPQPRPLAVLASARVGLFLKRGDLDAKARYLARPYRFLVEPALVRKGRLQLVLGLHREGRAPAEVARLTGVRLPQVERLVAAFERGRGRPARDYTGDLEPDRLAELLGACDG